MKNVWIKLILFVCTAAMLCGAAYHTILVKYQAIDKRYDTVQYALSQVEAKQYASEIEYGLKYGKQLEYYFNLDEMLRGIHMSSSYMRGVYVTGPGGDTLASSTNTALPALPEFQKDEAGAFWRCDSGGSTYIGLDIAADGATAGRLVMKFQTGVAHRLIENDRQKSLLQTAVFLAYVLALTAIVLARIHVGKAGRLLLLAGLLCALVPAVQLADLSVESLRMGNKIELETTRSAQRMAQVLQQQIDEVVDKGVSYADIGSMDAYFAESAASFDIVERFYLNTENRVVAVPSGAFITASRQSLQRAYWTVLAYQALAALGVWGCVAGVRCLWLYFERKRGAPAAAQQSMDG